MQMSSDSIILLSLDNEQCLQVACDFGGVACTWPPTLSHKGKQYKFVRNEVMQEEEAGHYGGRSMYKPVEG